MSIYPILVKGQRKAFGRQRITESSCTKKKTVDIYILSTTRNGERTIIQSIKISSGPATRMGVVGPVQQVHTNIYQRKDLNWLHVNDEPRVPERQQVKDQWSYISASGVYLIAARSNSPNMTTVLEILSQISWDSLKHCETSSIIEKLKLQQQFCWLALEDTGVHSIHIDHSSYHVITHAMIQHLFFYKQTLYKQLAFGWQIAKQFSRLNPLSLSNSKNYRKKKSGVFPL